MSLSPQEIVIPSPFPSPKTTNVQQSPTTLTTTQPPPPPPSSSSSSSSSSSTTTAGSSPSKKKEKKEKKKDTHRSPLISLLDLLDKPRHHGKLSRSASSTDFRESIVISRTDSHDGFNEAPPSASMTSSILDPALPPPIHPTRDTPTTATTKGGADKHPTTPTKQPYVTALDQDALALSNLNRGGGGASVYAITSPRHRKPIRETKETLSPFLSAVSNPLNHSGGKPGAKMHNNNNNIGTSAATFELAQDDIIGTEGTDNITINGSNGLGKNSEESALFGLEKSAALQESAFCNVLDLLLNGYMEPIRAQIDADYANDPVMHGELIVDMSPIFDGLANLYRSAVVQSEKLVDLVKRGVHFWIAKAYADFDDYVAAYRSFLNAHRRAIKKLASLKAVNSPLSGYVKSAGETLAKLNKSQYAGRVLEDLLRFCVARLSHLSNLAKAQYSIATSLRIARETCIISDFFSITCRVNNIFDIQIQIIIIIIYFIFIAYIRPDKHTEDSQFRGGAEFEPVGQHRRC